MECRRGARDVGQEGDGGSDRDSALPLGTGESMAYFDGKDIGGEQLDKPVAKVVSEPEGFVRVDFRHDPFEADRGI
jgi:hypothetical protein